MNNGINHLLTGAGFLPSTVFWWYIVYTTHENAKIGGGGSYCFTSIKNIHSTSNQPGAPRAPLKGKTIIHGLYHYQKNPNQNPSQVFSEHIYIWSSHHPIIPFCHSAAIVRGAAAADRGRRADPGDRHGRFVRRAADGRGAAAGRLGGADRHRPAALPRGSPGGGRKSHVGNHGGADFREKNGGKRMKHDETWWTPRKLRDFPNLRWIWIGYLPKIGGFDTFARCTTVCGPHSVLFPHWLLRDGQAFWSLTIDPQIIYEVTKLGLQG